MTDHQEWEQLMERYVSGECLPLEAQAFLEALAAHGESRAVIDAMRAARSAEAATAPGPAPLLYASASNSRAREQFDAVLHPSGRSRRMPTTSRPRWALWAAGVSVATSVAGASYALRQAAVAQLGQQPFREFASAPGGHATLTLRDGTQLILGPASHLRVPVDFGRRERTVALEGEALFTVVHDVAHPLTIRTAHAVIQDVGTTFSVHAYAADEQEQVAVQEGVVRIGGHLLRAHDVATIDTVGHLTFRTGVNVDPYLSWVQGGLVFTHAPLRDVLHDVGRAFDLDITVADSALLAHHITSSFGPESADEILSAVAIAVNAEVVRSGRHVVLRCRTGIVAPRPAVTPTVPRVFTDRTIHTTP